VNVTASLGFVFDGPERWTMLQRAALICRMQRVSYHVDCAHTESDILRFWNAVAALDSSVPGCIIEAGSYRGGGTAKLSWLAHLTGRRMKVFDSFRGIPANVEVHGRNIYGEETNFPERAYAGSLEMVSGNVARFGRPEVCDYIAGWFEESLPRLNEPIAAAYLDVDLASSTETCLRFIYPRLSPGGVIASHDGHLPLVQGVFRSEGFWRELGTSPPTIPELGIEKLILLRKAAAPHS
jgi:O-methyltransferase